MTSSEPTSTGTPWITGRVRIDERVDVLAARLEPGDIAVIDHADLSRENAQALAAARPLAVLDASRAQTGRQYTMGPQVLHDAGILLIDGMGPDVMTLREGEMVSLSGGEVRRGVEGAAGQLVAQGDVVEPPKQTDERQRMEDAAAQVEAFARSSADYFANEQALIVEGEGVPPLGVDAQGRPVVLVMPGPEAESDLRELRPWIRRVNPVIVGVATGADTAAAAGLRPQVVFGDVQSVGEKLLAKAASVVLHAQHDGKAPGAERLEKSGRTHEVFTTAGSDEDAAIILAAKAGASAVVTVGAHATVGDFLDRGRSGMPATFFSRILASDVVVSSKAVMATYRPPIAAGWLLLFVLAALLCVLAALWSTPWGNDLISGLFARVGDLFAAAPGAPVDHQTWIA